MSAPPNILWIVTTQWRAQACGFAGDRNARTPHLDALAARSVNYRQAVTPHPFGPFARAAMLTGTRSPANGVKDYFDPLPVTARTIAHELAASGYVTAFFGKWHLAKRDPAAPLVGEAHARTLVPREARGGFEVWDGFEGGFLLNDPWLQGRTSDEPVQVKGYQSDVVCARAADYLRERGGAVKSPAAAGRLTEDRRPFFAVVSLEAPHPPYDAPAGKFAPADPRSLQLAGNVPLGGEAEARARRELVGYYAHIAATDQAIGRVLLSKAPENTIVVFTSVHGDMHGAHGLFRKGWPHEESVRVPLLVCDPRETGAGRTDDAMISLQDLPAMTRAWSQGEAWRPDPLIRSCEISMPSVVALPHQCDRVWRGVRTRTRKLVLNADGSPWLFFDLAADPLERINLADDPARAAEIAALGAVP